MTSTSCAAVQRNLQQVAGIWQVWVLLQLPRRLSREESSGCILGRRVREAVGKNAKNAKNANVAGAMKSGILVLLAVPWTGAGVPVRFQLGAIST